MPRRTILCHATLSRHPVHGRIVVAPSLLDRVAMTLYDDLLGKCPDCETPLLEEQLLMKYRSSERWIVLAECPSCGEIVSPG